MTPSILVVEDDPHIAGNLEDTLTGAGYRVRIAMDGTEALREALLTPPDVVLLDLGLPDIPGEQVLHQLHEAHETRPVPVIVLTAYASPEDRNLLLEAGASDYLSKPYRNEELLSCVEAHLNPGSPTSSVKAGPLVFDLAARCVRCEGKDVGLLGTEFDVLLALARQPYRVVSAEELALRVHLKASAGVQQLVAIQVANVRLALEQAGMKDLVRVAKRFGYAFVPARA
ncbi:response regulator transcription factor [Deinococcus peraridilitoris]|uniref:Response regulator with CheY-like receiver domain and winged-helix DNA-binding domain protein n=1 Tax=Deinococcus peraridilitoris (strain DSM 19664 / LMG 22246 / CIP 109416 / KR-200) TaxID=937777 RepID=K9ZYA8_DEIPD|nr:response regulator transcription factor [Deinococcus peraridilitoris]AFZ66169.1 response regulator with CheY-like receiver domain and winged-helix DNA-binding domain protein [Deinococcus peraridilitoris DSM 19664]